MEATRARLAFIASCLSLLFVTSGVVAVAKESADGGKDRALLIGVSEYANLENLRVPGAVADVKMMQQILISRFGFREANITTLLDRQATRQAIMTELNLLVEQAGSDDCVFILYSGMGSRIPMRDEDDAFARAILSSDARNPRVPDISLGDLHDIVSKFQTACVTVSLDVSFRDRGAPRGGLYIRAVAPDKNIRLYKPRASEKGSEDVSTHPYVLLTASNQSQPALDGKIDGQRHGVFSYALGQVLAKADTNISADDILEALKGEMVRIQAQLGLPMIAEPRVEGPEGRLAQPLLTAGREEGAVSTRKSRLAWVEVGLAKETGEIVLVKGPALGALPNSSWAIYPPNETAFQPGGAQAVALVKALDGLDAIAQVIPPQAKIAPGSRAVPLTLPPVDNEVTIGIANMDVDQQQAAEAVVKRDFPDAKIVTDAGSARFVAEQYNGKLYLKAADGVQTLASFDPSSQAQDFGSATSLSQVLNRSKNSADLVALHNPSSQLRVEVRIPRALPTSIKRTPQLELTLLSSERLNEDEKEKKPLDLMVTVFPLTEAGVEMFRTASYESLFENRQKGLGAGLSGKPTTTKVLPNDTKSLTIRADPSTIAMGVAGFFRNPNGNRWKETIHLSSLSKSQGEHTEVRLSDRALQVIRDNRQMATRGIKSVAAKHADLEKPRFRIRGENDKRSVENSLQLEVKVNADSYMTIYDVDANGNINLLFPAACQADTFYKDGFMKGGEWVRIPDSIQSPNKSKCYFDLTEPPGTDTVQVLATTSLDTARFFRELLMNPSKNDPAIRVREDPEREKIKPQQIMTTPLVAIRNEMKTRGIKAVAERVSSVSHRELIDKKSVLAREGSPRIVSDALPMQGDWNTGTIAIEVIR